MVRNRLEQLRKRQRDEAFNAQKELLEGVKKAGSSKTWGGDMHIESVSEVANAAVEQSEEAEDYDREMSPEPMDPKHMSYEDRQLRVIDFQDDLHELVSCMSPKISSSTNQVSLAFITPQGCSISVCSEARCCTHTDARSFSKHGCGRR